MILRHRPMRSEDVRLCVDAIAAVPAARRRYGAAMDDLVPAWQRLKHSSKSATVFEKVEASGAAICAVGVSAFVHDDFVRE